MPSVRCVVVPRQIILTTKLQALQWPHEPSVNARNWNATMPINDLLTVREFATQTGLSESYVRSLIADDNGTKSPAIPTQCPVPGMRRPRLIAPELVEVWKQAKTTGRPRGPAKPRG